MAGMPFPTGGSKGHDAVHWARSFERDAPIHVDASDLARASCPSAVPYWREPSTGVSAGTPSAGVDAGNGTTFIGGGTGAGR